MTPSQKLITLFLGTILFTACSNNKDEVILKNDILLANMDTTVDPSEDFFLYANGGWIKRNPIPDDQSFWGIGNAVQEDLYTRLRTINESSLNAKDGIEKKVGDFWYSAMDTNGIERAGISPLQPELDAINNIKDLQGLLDVNADLHKKGIGVLYDDAIYQDERNSEAEALHLNQGGLGLPNREYYFNTDERTSNIRNAYKQHVARIFHLLGSDSAAAAKMSAAHFTLETRLAKASRKLEDLRDPYTNYNKYAVSNMRTLTPSIDWNDMLKKSGIDKIDSVIVGQPEFYKELDASLKSTPIEDWKNYLRFHLIRHLGGYLHDTIVNERFDFYGIKLQGAKKLKPRWKRMLDVQDDLMGEALGRVFVKEYFNEKAKKRYEDMVEAVRESLREHIQKLDWMSDSTKQKALAKLATMRKKVGYPDKWKDFSDMKIDRGPLVRNVINANMWWSNYYINKLGKPVNRDEWVMNPQTYNAYYNASNNEIVLPAGIFTVPGLRDEELDDALVYGYAGATTIGHEITHGFDDQGRQYDEKGNLTNWWTKEDEEKFNKRAQLMVKQFSEYIPVDTLRINGQATLGENIADLGGAVLALDAFKKTDTYKQGKTINGMTPLQRFFHGYALGWLGHIRNEALANQLLTDVHSPVQYRVNGPFVSIKEFYEAFNVKPGSKMYRPDSLRVNIW
ncbi:MAG TPA: M13 family metallopeptidase [Chitinophagaceae bacterium]|nr:M13 family metallopeptidase [Chitinophagaceae bacterium]